MLLSVQDLFHALVLVFSERNLADRVDFFPDVADSVPDLLQVFDVIFKVVDLVFVGVTQIKQNLCRTNFDQILLRLCDTRFKFFQQHYRYSD